MHFIVKLFPEIITKSAPVRRRFTRQLQNNLVALLKALNSEMKVTRDWEKLDVFGPDDSVLQARVTAVLAATPGVAFFYEVAASSFSSLDDIYQATAKIWGTALEGQSFCVRVKRQGQHEYSSMDIERYVGGGLNQNFPTGGVNLKRPDVTVKIEIRDQQLFVVKQQVAGLGGYPLGTQEDVVSLLSGGFDSTVASYLTMKRGLKTHFVFFNLGGRGHELGVKAVGHYLWQKFGASHSVKFVSVPFDEVVTEILTQVSDANMGVVLKRMMVRAANGVARQLRAHALVTGESVAQVSSQTLTNLSVIDQVAEAVVLRPLITTDKLDIINLARAIGTEDFAINMPEYCGVISRKPTTRAKLDRVEADEAKLSPGLVANAMNRARYQSIADVLEDDSSQVEVDEFAYVPTKAIVIDVRHPDEAEERPLQVPGVEVQCLPFYSLGNHKDRLQANQQYLLYCEQGIMSRLHAADLLAEGFHTIGVYRPR